MDWKSVAEKIIQDDQNKWEQTYLAEELEVTKLGLGVWPFSDHALTQFCQKLDIPVRYFRRLPDEMKITVANFDLRRLKGASFFVRGKGEWVRAFLSAEYVAYNNREIGQTVAELLGGGNITVTPSNEYACDGKLVSWETIKSFVHGFLKTNGSTETLPMPTSELPMMTPALRPDSTSRISSETIFRYMFVSSSTKSLRTAESISQGFQVASTILDAFLKTREDPIADPLDTIRKIAEARQFSQKLTDEIVSSYLVEPEANRFGLINAFTNAAQQMAPLQRIEMERFAGMLIEAPL